MIRISLISKHYEQIEPLIHQFFDNLQVEYILTNYTHQSIQDIYFVEIEKRDDLNILNHLKKLESTLIYIIGPKDFDLVSICLQMQTHLYFIIHLYLGTSWISFYEYNVGSRSKFFKIYSFRSQFRQNKISLFFSF